MVEYLYVSTYIEPANSFMKKEYIEYIKYDVRYKNIYCLDFKSLKNPRILLLGNIYYFIKNDEILIETKTEIFNYLIYLKK